jgi:hypothetical protein
LRLLRAASFLALSPILGRAFATASGMAALRLAANRAMPSLK